MNDIVTDYYSPAESSGGGYTCSDCHQWISSGMHHVCDTSEKGYGYSCPYCGQAVHGDKLDEHVCPVSPLTSYAETEMIGYLKSILAELSEIKYRLQ